MEKNVRVFPGSSKIDTHVWEAEGDALGVILYYRPLDNKRPWEDKAGNAGHIYVLDFGNGQIKVGSTDSASRRISQHRENIAKYQGVKIKRVWVSRRHNSYRETESLVLAALKPLQIKGEMFTASVEQVAVLLQDHFRQLEQRASELGFASHYDRHQAHLAHIKANTNSRSVFELGLYIPAPRAKKVRPSPNTEGKTQPEAHETIDEQDLVKTMGDLIHALAARQAETEKRVLEIEGRQVLTDAHMSELSQEVSELAATCRELAQELADTQERLKIAHRQLAELN